MSIKTALLTVPFLFSCIAQGAGIQKTCPASDSCYKAVLSNHNAPSSVRKAGCYSYMRTTVIPTPVTRTVTKLATSYTATTTVTSLSGVTQTTTGSTDVSVTSATTVDQSTTVVVEQDVQQTVTSEYDASYTAVVTTTVTTTVTAAAPPPAKRTAEVAKSCPTTAAAALGPVPTYASACSNTAAYMSACSCIGSTMQVKTLAACTSTVTVSSTTGLVKTVLQSGVSTNVQTVVVTVTHTVASTATNVVAVTSTSTSTLPDFVVPTTVSTVVATSTQTVVQTATATLTPNLCGSAQGLPANFKLVIDAVDGSFSSLPIGTSPYPVNEDSILIISRYQPATFSLDKSCRLMTPDGSYVANQDPGVDGDVIYFNSAPLVGPNGYAAITCSYDPSSTVVSCECSENNAAVISLCGGGSDDGYLVLGTSNEGCNTVRLRSA